MAGGNQGNFCRRAGGILVKEIRNSAFEYKKAANAPTDQSEALTATDTTENG